MKLRVCRLALVTSSGDTIPIRSSGDTIPIRCQLSRTMK
jgi:hypothetical protein